MSAAWHESNSQPMLVLTAPERFALAIDNQGIAAWYDLRVDPEQRANLVAAGARLLEHRAPDGARVQGTLRLLEQSAVRMRVAWEGQTPAPFRIEYTVWAGGHVAAQLHSGQPISSTLGGIVGNYGVALQQEAAGSSDGTFTTSLLLSLDAWAPEKRASLPLVSDVQLLTNQLALAYNPTRGALVATAQSTSPLVLSLPPDLVLRRPRFEIAAWPGDTLTLRRGTTTLVEGIDYLAEWDAASGTLSLQYLQPLGADPSERTFTFDPAPAAAPTLALTIVGREVDEQGRLIVDGNLPDKYEQPSTADTFPIPYIQSQPEVTVRAALESASANTGVEFVLTRLADGSSQKRRVAAAPFEASFLMPRMGEYRLDAYLLDASGTRLSNQPADSINPLGYGRVIIALGDSITAGLRGAEYRSITTSDEAIPDCPADKSPVISADKRNFYQYHNSLATGGPCLRGYELDLNDNLTTCSAAPVFILNNGFAGARTARGGDGGKKHLWQKMPSYQRHIQELGASDVLLGIGTNDVSSGQSPESWRGDLNKVVDGLQNVAAPPRIWIARIPWRTDSTNLQNTTSAFNTVAGQVVAAQDSITTPMELGPDFFNYFKTRTSLLDDTLHPNQNGYNSMADEWASTFCANLPPEPTVTPTQPTVTATSTITPSSTVTATETATPSSTVTATETATPGSTVTATETATPSSTVTATETATPSSTVTATETVTPGPGTPHHQMLFPLLTVN